jgi:hypothetical protein
VVREDVRQPGAPLRADLDRGAPELQYVWRESGEVGDSSPVAIELGIRDGLISSWFLIEEPD